MHGSTNHPGSDVMIRSKESGEVVAEYQLKAGSNEQVVREHFEKYPDTPVLATEEIAGRVDGSGSSGIRNDEITDEITDEMNGFIDDIAENTLGSRALDSGEMAGLVAAGREAIEVLTGERKVGEAGINVIKAGSVATITTAAVAFLFS